MAKYRDKIKDRFAEIADLQRRGPSAPDLHSASQMVSSPAYRYARAFCKEVLDLDETIKGNISSRIKLGKPKSVESIIRKAETEYNGDTTKIKDGARLTIYTHSPKEMEKALRVFAGRIENQDFNIEMRSMGYKFDHEKPPKDYITNPKRSGYMALYTNMKVGNATFEVQIYPESMRETYKKTHALYEELRLSGNLDRWQKAYDRDTAAGKKEPVITDFLTPGEVRLYQKILDMHRIAAEEAGLMKFVKKFPTLDCPPPVMDEPNIEPDVDDLEYNHNFDYNRTGPVYDA